MRAGAGAPADARARIHINTPRLPPRHPRRHSASPPPLQRARIGASSTGAAAVCGDPKFRLWMRNIMRCSARIWPNLHRAPHARRPRPQIATRVSWRPHIPRSAVRTTWAEWVGGLDNRHRDARSGSIWRRPCTECRDPRRPNLALRRRPRAAALLKPALQRQFYARPRPGTRIYTGPHPSRLRPPPPDARWPSPATSREPES